MNNKENESSFNDQISKRSLIYEMSQIKELSKYHTSTSVVEKRPSNEKPKKKNKKLNRVCCLKINPHWSLKKQISVTTVVVFIIVMSILMGFIGVFLIENLCFSLFFLVYRGICISLDITLKSRFEIPSNSKQIKI